MIRLFGKLFVREQLLRKRQTAAFWKYLGFVPLLLAYYQGSMVLRQVQDLSDIYLYMLVSRVILVTIGIGLILSVRSGYRQACIMIRAKERSMAIQEQLREIHDYADTMQEKQQLAIMRHDSRHQLRMLAELVESGHYDEAERQLLAMRKELKQQ